ncbi:NF038143 family protein [Desulfobacterales bacterium HSG16]|nr:NF038143 family protein [Desulfobacterales bacterium HSG16]
MTGPGMQVEKSRLEKNRGIVFEYEENFAFRLASKVVDRPELSIWMILMPIIFVFYFQKLKQFTDGRKQFVEKFLEERNMALDVSIRAIESGHEPDIPSLVEKTGLPVDAASPFGRWLEILVEHYTDLLKAEGENFSDLVRHAYRTRSNYLIFLNRLNQSEKDLNAALTPHLEKIAANIFEAVSAIEKESEIMRRESAQIIF